MKTKLTVKLVEEMKPRDKQFYIYDTDVSGLGVRVLPSGKKSWQVSTRLVGSRKRRWVKLADLEEIGIAEARKRAREEIRKSEDLHESLKHKPLSKAPLFKDAIETFIRDDRKMKKLIGKDGNLPPRVTWPNTQRAKYDFLKSASSRQKFGEKDLPLPLTDYEKRFPSFADRHIDEITQDDLKAYLNVFRDADDARSNSGYASFNNGKSYFSSFFAYWVEQKVCKSNPARGIKGAPKKNNPQALTIAEVERFVELLKERIEYGNPNKRVYYAIHMFRLQTGVRVEDALTVRWDDDGVNNFIDLEAGEVILRTDKTSGSRPKKEYPVSILGKLDWLFEQIGIRDQGLVFPSPNKYAKNNKILKRTVGAYFLKLRDEIAEEFGWNPVRKKEITQQNLRHSVATYLINKLHFTPDKVKAQLGHTDIRTTQKYFDANEDTRRNIKDATQDMFE